MLFAIIFLWTPPHFWALALFRRDDYARASVPMMPVAAGPHPRACRSSLYTLALVAAGLLPAIMGFAGPGYAIAAVLAGASMVASAWNLYRRREGKAADAAARKLFGLSILYLTILFAHAARRAGGRPPPRRDAGMIQERGGIVLSEIEKRRRRQRSIALALVLGALVVLFYAVTIVKQGAALDALHP